jgi:hypothetical protein
MDATRVKILFSDSIVAMVSLKGHPCNYNNTSKAQIKPTLIQTAKVFTRPQGQAALTMGPVFIHMCEALYDLFCIGISINVLLLYPAGNKLYRWIKK